MFPPNEIITSLWSCLGKLEWKFLSAPLLSSYLRTPASDFKYSGVQLSFWWMKREGEAINISLWLHKRHFSSVRAIVPCRGVLLTVWKHIKPAIRTVSKGIYGRKTKIIGRWHKSHLGGTFDTIIDGSVDDSLHMITFTALVDPFPFEMKVDEHCTTNRNGSQPRR